LVEISNDPLFLTLKSNTNDQFDFISFVAEACEKGKLSSGDYLICDNARIHKARATADLLQQLCDSFGFKVVYLPTYSPELNPCELVFNKTKHALRYHKDKEISFKDNILKAFSSISALDMTNFYLHTTNFDPQVKLVLSSKIYKRANV